MSSASLSRAESRVFTSDDQRAFALLSGDWNPIHTDSVQARRLIAGGAVVHGIHALLWALETWCAVRRTPFRLTSISATFRSPVLVDEALTIRDETRAGAALCLVLASGAREAARFEIGWRPGAAAVVDPLDSHPPRAEPLEHAADELNGQAGEVALHLPIEDLRRLLPNLAELMAIDHVAALLATTRIVGQLVPGLHSIYSELELRTATAQGPSMRYEVSKYDRRFRLATIAVSAGDLRGNITAFVRPRPATQPSCREIARRVAANAFCSQRALVVGGSRGLGEVTAKVLACGGADVLLTYHVGRSDAEAVVADIIASGGRARCAEFDVTGAAGAHDWQPTHLYYMATPHITPGEHGGFSRHVFDRLAAFYTTGFANTFRIVQTPALRGVFYPSSVFVNETSAGMAEYAAAKAAGEAVARALSANAPAVRFAIPRLRRMSTDQTSSVIAAERAEVLSELLPVLLQFGAA